MDATNQSAAEVMSGTVLPPCRPPDVMMTAKRLRLLHEALRYFDDLRPRLARLKRQTARHTTQLERAAARLPIALGLVRPVDMAAARGLPGADSIHPPLWADRLMTADEMEHVGRTVEAAIAALQAAHTREPRLAADIRMAKVHLGAAWPYVQPRGGGK